MDKPQKDILIGFICLALEIVLLYYLWKNNLMLSLILLFISAIILTKFSNKKEKILYFLGFVFLPIFDLTLVPRGVWTYGNPTIYGVPIWLPFSYGLGTVMIVKIGNSIGKLYFKS